MEVNKTIYNNSNNHHNNNIIINPDTSLKDYFLELWEEVQDYTICTVGDYYSSCVEQITKAATTTMGATYSLQIELHKQRGETEATPVTAGSVLQGKVRFELTSPLYLEQPLKPGTTGSAVNLSLLTLRIYGKEKVKMKLSAAKRRARAYGHTNALAAASNNEYPYPREAERQFFDVTLPLGEFPTTAYNAIRNCIMPGSYKFPFQIQLPSVLPSSSSYNPYTRSQHNPTNRSWNGKKPGFRIQYKMFVIVHSVTKKDFNGGDIHSAAQHLWVVSAPKTSIQNDPVPSMVLPLAHELQTSHGLWTQGTVLTAASIDDSIVSRSDDHLNIHIACRNNSRAEIQRIQMQLVEKICWGTVASAGDMTGSVLQEENNLVLFALKDIQLPTLQKEGKSMLQSMAQTLLGTKNRTEQEFLKSIYKDLQSDQSKVSITLPLKSLARDSYSGQLVQVSHQIEIKFVTNNTTANSNNKNLQQNNNPSIIIPVRMVNGERHSIEATGSFCNSIAESEDEKNEELLHVANPGFADEAAIEAIDHPSSIPVSTGDGVIPMAPPVIYSNQPEKPGHKDSTGIPMAVGTMENDVIVLGGDTKFTSNAPVAATNDPHQLQESPTPLSDLVPMAPPQVRVTEKVNTTANKNEPPSMGLLLSEMRSSIDAYSIVLDKTTTMPQWIRFFERISPFEFGQIIANVPDPFDQPRVASLIGQHVNQKEQVPQGLTCEYIAFAIRYTSETHRATTAQGLLPMCVDAAENHKLILNELSFWDQTVIASTLETAMIETMPQAKKGKLSPKPSPITGKKKPVASSSVPGKLQPAVAC